MGTGTDLVKFSGTGSGTVKDLTAIGQSAPNVDPDQSAYSQTAATDTANSIFRFRQRRALRSAINGNYKFSMCNGSYNFKWVANTNTAGMSYHN